MILMTYICKSQLGIKHLFDIVNILPPSLVRWRPCFASKKCVICHKNYIVTFLIRIQ